MFSKPQNRLQYCSVNSLSLTFVEDVETSSAGYAWRLYRLRLGANEPSGFGWKLEKPDLQDREIIVATISLDCSF